MSQDTAPAADDARVWVGRLMPGHEAEHERFLVWLSSPEAHDIFRRRRLTEYRLYQEGDDLTVLFTAPRTGDPTIMIGFLRYPGLWPDYWQFQHGGRPEDVRLTSEPRVHWRRDGEG